MERFPDQESCIAHLEKMCWKGKPKCPHCESTHVGRRTETEEGVLVVGIATIAMLLSKSPAAQCFTAQR